MIHRTRFYNVTGQHLFARRAINHVESRHLVIGVTQNHGAPGCALFIADMIGQNFDTLPASDVGRQKAKKQ